MKTRHTEETGIEIKRFGKNHWQHVDTSTGTDRQVGPIYKSKDEILSDHESYLERAWGL